MVTGQLGVGWSAGSLVLSGLLSFPEDGERYLLSPCPSRLAANTVWRRPKVAYSFNDASSSAESGTITKMQDVDVKK